MQNGKTNSDFSKISIAILLDIKQFFCYKTDPVAVSTQSRKRRKIKLAKCIHIVFLLKFVLVQLQSSGFPDPDIPHPTQTCTYRNILHSNEQLHIPSQTYQDHDCFCSFLFCRFLGLWLQLCRHISKLINLIIFLPFKNDF